MAVTSIKTGSSFNSLIKYNDFLGPNSAYIPTSFDSIASATGTGSSGTITFSSIPQTYKSLQIRGIGRLDVGTGGVSTRIRLNGDTTSNYAEHLLYGNGTSALTSNNAPNSWTYMGRTPGSTANTNVVGAFIIDIHDYASTTKNKTIRVFNGVDNNAADTDFWVAMASGLWMSTSAVTSITLNAISTYNWTTETQFALYGIN
jgi:hypothetical protein